MKSLLNTSRPPVFCPGCLHERVVQALDRALQAMGLAGHQIAIVTDIGCSGLLDTFFNTHAVHGLHGRALTYATGLKLACPSLTVIVIMGDGGLGIGGAHVLGSCRRNLNINLLILNNFNYGMTGGQCSATTPSDAETASSFLGRLEAPLDICSVARAAGAPYVRRCLVTDKAIVDHIREALAYPGFSVTDIRGLCPGRFGRRNRKTISEMEREMKALPTADGPVGSNERQEFGSRYRQEAVKRNSSSGPDIITARYRSALRDRCSIIMLGAAGQRINTAGTVLCTSAIVSGLYATQKSDYPITVLRGYSVCEIILSNEAIGFTGIDAPDIIIALAPEGIARRRTLFGQMRPNGLVIAAAGLQLPPGNASVLRIDHHQLNIPGQLLAVASLALLTRHSPAIDFEALMAGLDMNFSGNRLAEAESIAHQVLASESPHGQS